MRIGISCYPTFGGSGVVACELAIKLVGRGHQVHVLSYDLPARLQGVELADPDDPEAAEQAALFFHRVTVRHYPLFEYPPYSLALANEMVQVARRFSLEVLHVHYAVPNAVSALLARQILEPDHLPVVTTLHGTDVTLVGNDPSYLETTRWSVARSDAVTAVSGWLVERTREQLGTPAQPFDRPIEVIPNFVDATRFAACRPRRDDVPVLVHVSNYRRVKRPDRVLATFAELRRRRPCRLRMVGDGPQRPAAEELARELGVGGEVEWLDNDPAVEKALDGAALFVLTSEQESFGLAALEAMAAGVPVLSTRVGGLEDVVGDGTSGRLVDSGDPERLADAAEELLSDAQRWRRFSRLAREEAASRFSVCAVVERYLEVYRTVNGGASP